MAMLTLDDYIQRNIRALSIFQKYGIEAHERLNDTLESVCEEFGIPLISVKAELLQTKKIGFHSIKKEVFHFNRWDTDILMDYFLNHYHAKIKLQIIEIERQIRIVEMNLDIANFISQFKDLAHWLEKLMKIEEQVLFPALRKLVNKNAYKIATPIHEVNFIISAINRIENQHKIELIKINQLCQAADALKRNFINNPMISKLIKRYYGFEKSLRMYMLIEGACLFRRIKLEVLGVQSAH